MSNVIIFPIERCRLGEEYLSGLLADASGINLNIRDVDIESVSPTSVAARYYEDDLYQKILYDLDLLQEKIEHVLFRLEELDGQL